MTSNGKAVSRPNPPVRQYSFTGFQVSNPATPPPGDRLDSEYAQTNKAVSDIIAWVGTSLNNDGSLRADAIPAPATTDTGDAALASLYATLAGAWAEYMPGTIPPNILAVMDITGDHWSARWWAHQALTVAQLLVDGTLPPSPPLAPTGPTVLPPAAAGDINIRNNTAAPMTLTLPATPVPGQALKFKDVLGNAGTYPITLAPQGTLIDGQTGFFMYQDYQAVELYWTGTGWGVR